MARGTENEFFLEKDLQAAVVRDARAAGWFARRYTGTGRRGLPDYMFARAGRVWWIEFKLPGNEPTPLQWGEIRAMRAAGLNVGWTDSRRACQKLFKAENGGFADQ